MAKNNPEDTRRGDAQLREALERNSRGVRGCVRACVFREQWSCQLTLDVLIQ